MTATVFLIFSFLFAFLALRSFVYFKPVSVLRVDPSGSSYVVSLKPNRRWFRSLAAGGLKVGTVRLSSSIVAVYTVSDDPDSLSFGSVCFVGSIYLLRSSRFKYKSIDLSDRSVSDVLSKFKFMEVSK